MKETTDQGQEVYIVQTGEVLISRGGAHLAVIGAGESLSLSLSTIYSTLTICDEQVSHSERCQRWASPLDRKGITATRPRLLSRM